MKKYLVTIVGILLVIGLLGCQQAAVPSEPKAPVEVPSAPAPTPSVPVDMAPVPEAGPQPVATTQVSVEGWGTFNPPNIVISAGESVTFTNNFDKRLVIVTQPQGEKFGFENSRAFSVGKTFEKVFNEPGVYTFVTQAWTEDFGEKGTITVQ